MRRGPDWQEVSAADGLESVRSAQNQSMEETTQRERYQITLKILTGLLFLAFAAALLIVIRPLWTPLLWAVVLTTSTWPTYKHLRKVVRKPLYLAPLIASVILGILLILVLVALPLQLTSEVKTLAAELRATDPRKIADALGAIPFVGDFISSGALTLLDDPGAIAAVLEEHQATLFSFATSAARGVLSTAVTILGSLVGCFILYRHGEMLVEQLRNILRRLGGGSVAKLIDTVDVAVRGAAYSVLATAAAQGVLAGVGYYISGAPTPLLLAMLTLVISFVPFGPPFMYIPVAAYLFFGTDLPWYHGAGLAAWGIVVISTVDNILRPLFISQSTKMSTILVFVGVLGGAASFGLLGVFIGPALIVIAQLFWLELAQPDSA